MIGYIYYCINKINGKRYVGQTMNFKNRKSQHLSELRKGTHHSHKLQRAFNKYGEDNFNWQVEMYELDSIDALYKLEIDKIKEYDSYQNGYNETLGGDGNRLLFSFEEASLIYEILQRYDGVGRQIARYFKCDHSVIQDIGKNDIYKNQDIDETKVLDLIQKIGLEEKNLKENYIPHNKRKLDQWSCIEILSIITTEDGYDRLLADIFNINTKLLWRLKQGLIYKEYLDNFKKLTNEQKKIIKEEVKKKYDLEHKRLVRKRGNVKNPLTQEQINYILDNKNIKKQVEIAKELDISADRVSSVIRGLSYKDLIENYYSSRN